MESSNLYHAGVVGLINESVLATVILWFWGYQIYLNNSDTKKHFIYFLLFFATICDIPMYVSFVTIRDYSLETYSFHKLVAATLFAAYSITLSDWAKVLHEIHEQSHNMYLLNQYTLLTVNCVFIGISLANFIYCFAMSDVSKYTQSLAYLSCEVFQIIAPLVLTLIMLLSGVKLTQRIRSATVRGTNPRLLEATITLTGIMIACAICITVQIGMAFLNLLSNYANEGPYYYFWTFYEWVPLWAITLSLLYLNRSNVKKTIQSSQDDKYSSLIPSKSSNRSNRQNRLNKEKGASNGSNRTKVNSGDDGNTDDTIGSDRLIFVSNDDEVEEVTRDGEGLINEYDVESYENDFRRRSGSDSGSSQSNSVVSGAASVYTTNSSDTHSNIVHNHSHSDLLIFVGLSSNGNKYPSRLSSRSIVASSPGGVMTPRP